MQVQSEAAMTLEAPARSRVAARLHDYMELTKPRITALVVLTTYVGFHLGAVAPFGWVYVAHLLLGTALACAGSSTLNQWWERDRDARMRRTADRPLPAGRMTPDHALAFGVAITIAGLVELDRKSVV